MKFEDEENQQERNKEQSAEQPAESRNMPATRDKVKEKAAVADETITKIASKKPPTHMHEVLRVSLIALIALFFYILVGTVVYQKLAYDQGWTTIDATYFCLVTMSTVGYGDLVPLTTGNRAFTIVMIFVGIIFVFTTVSSAVGVIMRPVSDAGRALMERLFPQRPIDINRNGQPDFMAPRHPVIFYSKNLVPSILLNTAIQLISAGVFLVFEEWSFGEAFYHCLVTATTVGYGDIGIVTQGGRLWACFHILISVALLGELFSALDELRQKRKRAVQKVRQLAAEISPNLLQNLHRHVPSLRRPDLDNDGDNLTDLEYVLGMLIELELITPEDVEPFLKRFWMLDVNGDRQLDSSDWQKLAELSDSEKKAAEQALAQATQGLTFGNAVFDKLAQAIPLEGRGARQGEQRLSQRSSSTRRRTAEAFSKLRKHKSTTKAVADDK